MTEGRYDNPVAKRTRRVAMALFDLLGYEDMDISAIDKRLKLAECDMEAIKFCAMMSAYNIPEQRIVATCKGERYNLEGEGIPCGGVLYHDDTMGNTCGEPCSFVMRKGGSSKGVDDEQA